MPEPKKPRRPRISYERRYHDAVKYCRVSIEILESMLEPEGDCIQPPLRNTQINGEINAFRKVLKQLGEPPQNGGSSE